jgi:heme/copper-type cytochrome/quinol oxidase subunit 3
MSKLLLLSVMIMMVAIPVVAARDKSTKRGLQKAILFTIVFNIFYVLALRYIYPHLIS